MQEKGYAKTLRPEGERESEEERTMKSFSPCVARQASPTLAPGLTESCYAGGLRETLCRDKLISPRHLTAFHPTPSELVTTHEHFKGLGKAAFFLAQSPFLPKGDVFELIPVERYLH